jgi:hypothetical protein
MRHSRTVSQKGIFMPGSILSFLSGQKGGVPRGRTLVVGGTQAKHPPPNTADYVDWLLADMLRGQTRELLVSASAPLPSKSQGDGPPWPYRVPEHQAVINRLKILSGRNPLPFAARTEGEILRPHGDHVVVHATAFDDQASPPVCTIRVQVRRRSPQPSKADR